MINRSEDPNMISHALKECSTISPKKTLTISDLPEDLIAQILSFATNNVRHHRQKTISRSVQSRHWVYSRVSHTFRRAFFKHVSSLSINRPESITSNRFNIKDWNSLHKCTSLRELIVGSDAELTDAMLIGLFNNLSLSNIRLTKLDICLNQRLTYLAVYQYANLFGPHCQSLRIVQPSQQYRTQVWRNLVEDDVEDAEYIGNGVFVSPYYPYTPSLPHPTPNQNNNHVPTASALMSSLQNFVNPSTGFIEPQVNGNVGTQSTEGNPAATVPSAEEQDYQNFLDYMQAVIDTQPQNTFNASPENPILLQFLSLHSSSSGSPSAVPQPNASGSQQISMQSAAVASVQTANATVSTEQGTQSGQAQNPNMDVDQSIVPATPLATQSSYIGPTNYMQTQITYNEPRATFRTMGLNAPLLTQLLGLVPNLRELKLNNFAPITADMVKPLRSLKSLEVLEIVLNHIDDQILQKLLSSYGNLQHLTLSQLNAVGDKAMKGLCKSNSRLKLKSLELDRVGRVTDPAIKNLVNACPNLTCVKISHCRQITNFAASHLSCLRKLQEFRYNPHFGQPPEDRTVIYLSCAPVSLRCLYLSSCTRLTMDGIMALRQLPQLRALRLDGLGTVTQDMMRAIGLFPRLDSLVLSGSMHLSDLSVKVLCAQRGHRFLHLTIQDSTNNLTNEALECIMTWCNSLRTLYVTGEFTRDVMNAVEEYMPHTSIRLSGYKNDFQNSRRKDDGSDDIPDWAYYPVAEQES